MSTRRRQREKLRAAEQERRERQEQEAEEELAERTVRSVVFDVTLENLESAFNFDSVEIIEGTNWRPVCLKRGGIYTREGARLRAQLLEAAKK